MIARVPPRGVMNLLAGILIFAAAQENSARADGEGRPKRYSLGIVMGQTGTPAVLGTEGGGSVEGTYLSPEIGYSLGFQMDFAKQMALDVRPIYIARNITYTQSTGLRDIEGSLSTTSIHLPIQVKLIPKRWISAGVGIYGDYSLSGGQGLDLGSVFSGSLEFNLGKKFGIFLSFHYNSSFYTIDDISKKEYLLLTGFRFGSNKTPSIE